LFIEEDAARALLAPCEGRISGVIDRAWSRFAAMPDRPHFNLKRAIATVVHQFMVNELRIEFAGDRDVYLIEEHETVRMLFARRLVVRLKKMDEHGVTRAAPTQAALGFILPHKPLMLPFAPEDVPPETPSIDMGYVLNELCTRIEQKLVAARYGDAVLWSYPFGAEAAAADAVLIPAPKPPASPASIITVPDDAAAKRKKSED
jgi:hypothetical protein